MLVFVWVFSTIGILCLWHLTLLSRIQIIIYSIISSTHDDNLLYDLNTIYVR